MLFYNHLQVQEMDEDRNEQSPVSMADMLKHVSSTLY